MLARLMNPSEPHNLGPSDDQRHMFRRNVLRVNPIGSLIGQANAFQSEITVHGQFVERVEFILVRQKPVDDDKPEIPNKISVHVQWPVFGI